MINEIINTLAAYGIIIAPSLLSILGIVLGIIKTVKNAKETSEAVSTITEQALNAFSQIKDSNEFKELKLLVSDVLKENKQLKASLIECTETLSRIRNKHPELFVKTDDLKED